MTKIKGIFNTLLQIILENCPLLRATPDRIASFQVLKGLARQHIGFKKSKINLLGLKCLLKLY